MRKAASTFDNLTFFKIITFLTILAGCAALSDIKDDKFCVIHVGPHKTGSSTLQKFFLTTHRDDLGKDNYKTPPAYPPQGRIALCLNTNYEDTALCRPDMGESVDVLEMFQSFVDNAAAHGSNILLSGEQYDRPGLMIPKLTSFLVPHGYKIHIVVYYRRFYDWIYSFYNQVIKSNKNEKQKAQRLTFVEWLTDDILEQYQQLYSHVVYDRFREAPGIFNVSIVNMHEDPDNFNINARFACDHMDQAPHLCEIAKSIPPEHSNPSRDVGWKLFSNSINIYHPIEVTGGGSKQIQKKFFEMADYPMRCLSPEMKAKVLQISKEAEIALTPEWWYNSEEGLKHMLSDFEEKMNSKLCSMDIEKILTSSEWQDFLTKLAEGDIEEGL